MAYTKNEFYQTALNELCNDGKLAERIQIGDVTITQQFGAMAQMLAMLSMQIDLGTTEYWTRARSSFVLADAAARQILPFGQAKVYKIMVQNQFNTPLTLLAGRRLLDQRSRVWVVQNGAVIPAGGSADLTLKQYNETAFTHAVEATQSFYQIPIPEPEPNQTLIGLSVANMSTHQPFKHVERFNNIENGEPVYHILADEYLNLFIQFGLKNKLGYVPSIGEQFQIRIQQSHVDYTIEAGAQFSLEYIRQNEENLSFFAVEELERGNIPADIGELRELIKYPFLYDENAVFLGEFSQLVSRKLRPFVFLSIWNENIEERTRGASVDNINKLFISFIKDDADSAEIQQQIIKVIGEADNSYRIQFVDTKEVFIGFQVKLWISPLHDFAHVEQKVRLWILNQFGRSSAWARRGRQRINISDTTKSLKEAVIELSDGTSDVLIEVDDPELDLPEAFRYVAEETLSVSAISLISD